MYEVRIGCAFIPITITIISCNAEQLRKTHFASFARYRDIDMDIKRDAVSVLE